MSATVTGDASHNSRWGNVNGWRRTLPLPSHSLRAARLFSGIGVFSSINVRHPENRHRHQLLSRRRATLQFARRKEPPGLPHLWTLIPARLSVLDSSKLFPLTSLRPFA